MIGTPRPVVILIVGVLARFASRSATIVGLCCGILFAIGWFGMWEDTMKTISMIFVCAVLSIVIGLPIGIAMARSTACRVS